MYGFEFWFKYLMLKCWVCLCYDFVVGMIRYTIPKPHCYAIHDGYIWLLISKILQIRKYSTVNTWSAVRHLQLYITFLFWIPIGASNRSQYNGTCIYTKLRVVKTHVQWLPIFMALRGFLKSRVITTLLFVNMFHLTKP